MKSIIEQKMKEKRLNDASSEFRDEYKMKTLENVISDLEEKDNRFVFYCPDIVMVNSLAKLIYETAYEVYFAGYEVVILHEINGFKPKWLFENEEYKHLKELTIDYIIKQKSSKSKKTKSQYAFKPADTLIVPDQFIEMFENLVDVKILQKVLLVTSYTALSSIQPGVTLSSLGIDKVLFTEKKLAQDYSSLFSFDSSFIDNYPINNNVFKGRKHSEVLPLITISQIGNTDFAQQIINVFYNKYPNLRVFNFRLLDRNSIDIYVENLQKAALCLIIDKSLTSNQMIYEILSMGCPVLTTKRQELNETLSENIYCGDTAFEIAENLALFCQTWLNTSTEIIDESSSKLVNLQNYEYEAFKVQVEESFEGLRQDRLRYFNRIKESFDNAVSRSDK